MILLESDVFLTQWRNVVREMLMNVLLNLCMQLVHLLMLTGNIYWEAYTPPTRHALSTHLLDAEFNRVQVKVKEIIEKADCIAITSDGWSNVCGQGIINYISTPQPVFYKITDKGQETHQSLHCR